MSQSSILFATVPIPKHVRSLHKRLNLIDDDVYSQLVSCELVLINVEHKLTRDSFTVGVNYLRCHKLSAADYDLLKTKSTQLSHSEFDLLFNGLLTLIKQCLRVTASGKGKPDSFHSELTKDYRLVIVMYYHD